MKILKALPFLALPLATIGCGDDKVTAPVVEEVVEAGEAVPGLEGAWISDPFMRSGHVYKYTFVIAWQPDEGIYRYTWTRTIDEGISLTHSGMLKAYASTDFGGVQVAIMMLREQGTEVDHDTGERKEMGRRAYPPTWFYLEDTYLLSESTAYYRQ